MYPILLSIQIIALVVTMLCTVMLARLRSSIDHKFLLISAIASDIYLAGYLMEMLATSQEGALVAVAFEYMGLVYCALSYCIYIFNYCHVKWVPSFVWKLFFAIASAVFGLVISCRYQSIYYTSIKFVDTGLFPHLETTKSLIYWVFAVLQAVWLIASAIVIIKRRKQTAKTVERRKLLALFFESLIPLGGIALTTTNALWGFDASPAMIGVMVTCITITLSRGHLFDITNVARERMFQIVDTGIIVTDIEHNYVDSNGFANSIFPQLTIWESGHDVAELGINLFKSKREYRFEFDGKYYQSSYAELWEKKTHVGYIISISDVTAMRKSAEDMRILKEEADAANEAKSAFLANMSHEIRTPLNAIIGMAELSSKEKSEAVVKEYVSQIESAGKMLLGIVSDVLDFSKAESGKLELVPVEFDTAEFLNSIINVTGMRIGDKPVDFIVDISPDIPARLYGDDVHIRQVLMNILGNAEKFTESGHIKLTLDFKAEGHGVRLFAEVEDTGIGIRKEDEDKLFNAFQQVDMKKNRKLTGSGLGLAIFAQLVTLMNGSYHVESEYGKGSKFFFDLELDVVNTESFAPGAKRDTITVPKLTAFNLYGTGEKAESDEAKADAEKALSLDYSSKAILVVDDNKVNVKVISAFLKHFGIIADSAFSGQEAIDMVQKKKYDLIFMDHMMPEMDGVETTEHIRDLEDDYFRQVPIIACTANVVKGVEELFAQAGMDDFVPKPIQIEVLQQKLEKFLGK